jgi:hypothetical protein
MLLKLNKNMSRSEQSNKPKQFILDEYGRLLDENGIEV